MIRILSVRRSPEVDRCSSSHEYSAFAQPTLEQGGTAQSLSGMSAPINVRLHCWADWRGSRMTWPDGLLAPGYGALSDINQDRPPPVRVRLSEPQQTCMSGMTHLR